jgi:threonine dehydratase
VHALLQPTLLHCWPGLCEQVGTDFYLKHENHQPVGAFKVRGGVNLISTLSSQERASGVIAVSTGNHGQSLAYASRHFEVPCTIVVPQGNNPDKNQAIRQLGAKLIEHGRDFDEAREYVEAVVRERGSRYVHSANEPKLIAGVGTMAWEIFERLPDPDVILVPIGLGSGVCGTCVVAKHRRRETKVIGVQSNNAAAVARSWKSGQWETDARIDTWAEGMATRVPAEMTLRIMRALMDDVILVSEDELRRAAWMILKHTHNLPEGAGAAALAAALQQRERWQGRKVVGILSGGNLDLAQLPRILKYDDRERPT